MGLFPTRSEAIQRPDQLRKEEYHDFTIGIRLCQTKEDLTLRIDSGDHGNAGLQWQHFDGICVTMLPPFPTPKIAHTKPRFIYVNNDFLLEVYIQESKCKLLPKDLAFWRILCPIHGFDFPVAHFKVISEHFSNDVVGGHNLVLFCQFFSEIIHRVNELIFTIHFLNLCLDLTS